MVETKEVSKPLDPEEVRAAFGSLRRALKGTSEMAVRAQRLALSAERRADESRLDAHAAEVQAKTCKLDSDSYWRFLSRTMEDLVALRGRIRVVENALGVGSDRDSGGGDDTDGD